ncbi:MAG: UDP-N-acetylmuramate dehydrogenase [Rickettsiales bacterium]|jgi:UDP-N-acetylmuramate dehydrogenase|nr:UDP-N-acetylmuramate dehydrogenase [Rickettsiales bacterium]
MAEFKTDISLAKFTRFRTGGRADLFFAPDSVAELSEFLRANSVRPIMVLGLGSNVLIRDGGIGGVVIFTGGLNKLEFKDGVITAGAGVAMPLISGFASRHNAPGFEFMIGIPGSAAGGVATNAGCFGGQISDLLIGVLGLNFNGETIEIPADALYLSYRAAKIPADFIITELKFRAVADGGKNAEIRKKMDGIITKKAAAQPIDMRTAGSVFKNPAGGGGCAWRIIKDAFPNGLVVGGARISDRHANFIVADGECQSADIESLIKQIQDKTGLELEIRILGKL